MILNRPLCPWGDGLRNKDIATIATVDRFDEAFHYIFLRVQPAVVGPTRDQWRHPNALSLFLPRINAAMDER